MLQEHFNNTEVVIIASGACHTIGDAFYIGLANGSRSNKKSWINEWSSRRD